MSLSNELTLRCWHYRSIQAVVLSSTFASNGVVSNYDETFFSIFEAPISE